MKNFLKGKIKNKFIASIVLIIAIIVGTQWYISQNGIDTNTYIVLVKGEVYINESILRSEDRKVLAVGDEIITKKNSICVIEWGDGSLTRLGENGKIIIEELNVEEDLSKINLQFKLTEGKTWSNVVSFLGEKSYFKQNFEDIEASVRGTVFDVDLSTDILAVQNHEVALQKGEQTTVIKEGTAFNFSSFSFVDIQEFIHKIRDKAWEEFNIEGDQDYLELLKMNFLEKFPTDNITEIINKNIGEKAGTLEELENTIESFSKEKKVEVYNTLLKEYQKLNFASADDGKFFLRKNKVKKLLIVSAGDEDKKSLIQYSIYDLKDAIDGGNYDSIKDTLSLIGENKDILETLNTDVLSDINVIPDGLQGALEGHFDTAKELFKNTPDFNINIDNLQGKANEIRDDVIGKFGELVNDLKK